MKTLRIVSAIASGVVLMMMFVVIQLRPAGIDVGHNGDFSSLPFTIFVGGMFAIIFSGVVEIFGDRFDDDAAFIRTFSAIAFAVVLVATIIQCQKTPVTVNGAEAFLFMTFVIAGFTRISAEIMCLFEALGWSRNRSLA